MFRKPYHEQRKIKRILAASEAMIIGTTCPDSAASGVLNKQKICIALQDSDNIGRIPGGSERVLLVQRNF